MKAPPAARANLRLTAAIVIAIVLTGCAAHSTPTGSTSTGTRGRPPAQLTAAANNETVAAIVGQELVITLPTTNWSFDPNPSDAGVLRQQPEVVTKGRITCRSLSDCGSVSVRVLARKPGRATVRATREKCGELLLCQGAAGRFVVTLVVR